MVSTDPAVATEAVRLCTEEGMSQTAVAARLGVNRKTVGRWLRDHGIPVRPRRPPSRPAELDDPEWLRIRYVEGRIGAQTIADEVGVSVPAVLGALRRHGIGVRPPGGLLADADQAALLGDADWLHQRLHVDLVPMVDVAAELGVSHSTLGERLDALGVDRPSVRSRVDARLAREGVDADWVARRHRVDRMPVTDIAAELGTSIAVVRDLLVEAGVEPIDGRRLRRDARLNDRAWLEAAYAQRPVPEIAEELGVSHKTVYRWLHRHGLVVSR